MEMKRFLAVVGLAALAGAAQQFVDTESWRPLAHTLSGSIVDSSGAAIAGAELRLWARERGARLELGATASDLGGRFELPWTRAAWDMEQSRATLVVTAPRFAPTVLDNVFLTAASYDVGLLTLHAPVELRGHVRTRDGAPIAGARVYGVVGPVRGLQPELWNLDPIAVSDEAGAYTCHALPPGRVTLSAGAIGFADAADGALTLEVGSANTRDFVLNEERVTTLTVTSTLSKPIADVEVGPPGAASGMTPQFEYASTRAFWRGPYRGDEHGVVRIDGVAASTKLDVRIQARGYREAFVPLRSDTLTVRLTPVTWIEVTAARRSGSAPIELHQVRVRDGNAPTSRCGLAEDVAWRQLWADSAAVEVLAPNRWRIAWNSPECIVDGGAPSAVIALATDGSVLHQKLQFEWPSPTVECRLLFDAPTSVTGIVRDVAGQPVSLRIGTQLGVGRPDYITTTSDARGRFTFTQLAGERLWLHSLDRRWALEPGSTRFELTRGAVLSGVELEVRERQPEVRSTVRGQLLIDGRPPNRAVLLAFESGLYAHVPDHAPDALVWTDLGGRFELTDSPSVHYHVVPQFRPHFEPSGWVEFGGGFPRHSRLWPFVVTLPDTGVTEVMMRLPAESAWNSIAPPRDD